MYGKEFAVSEDALDKNFLIEFGKAKIMKEGENVTILAYSRMVEEALKTQKILEKTYGVSAEVINMRCLRPYDAKTVINSVKKTNHLVVVEEGWPQCGFGAEICGLMMDCNF